MGWSGLLLLSLWGVWESMQSVSVASAYLGFASVIVMWGWHELAFLTGWLTGPRRQPLTAGARGWQRFAESAQAVLWHELGLLANLALEEEKAEKIKQQREENKKRQQKSLEDAKKDAGVADTTDLATAISSNVHPAEGGAPRDL
jgi:hypothetical protein